MLPGIRRLRQNGAAGHRHQCIPPKTTHGASSPIADCQNRRQGRTASNPPGPHRDPFERMLIAQALLANSMLVSKETAFDRCGVRRI
jgi:hypothetical protein